MLLQETRHFAAERPQSASFLDDQARHLGDTHRVVPKGAKVVNRPIRCRQRSCCRH